MSYVYRLRFLYTQYVIRKYGVIFMIADSPIVVDKVGFITMKERVFKGSKGLWEMVTREKVNTEFITKDDLKTI